MSCSVKRWSRFFIWSINLSFEIWRGESSLLPLQWLMWHHHSLGKTVTLDGLGVVETDSSLIEGWRRQGTGCQESGEGYRMLGTLGCGIGHAMLGTEEYRIGHRMLGKLGYRIGYRMLGTEGYRIGHGILGVRRRVWDRVWDVRDRRVRDRVWDVRDRGYGIGYGMLGTEGYG